MTGSASAALLPRHLDSWIDGYLRYTEGVSSPEIFRKWAAITTVGAALERRVWTWTAKGPTFANMFVILVGPPGTGKSEAIGPCRALIQATKSEGVFEVACHIAPNDITKGRLLDFLASKAVRRFGPDPEAERLEIKEDFDYNAAYLMAPEMGRFVREKDNELLNALHDLWDGKFPVSEERRYRADQTISIKRPLMSLLGGTTTAFLSRTFPPAAWDEGFLSRCIMIYSTEKHEPDLFGDDDYDPMVARELIEDLRAIGKMAGQLHFTDAAKKAILKWQKSGYEPRPTHIRLEHYNTRRMRHALKLSIIASANRSNSNIIDVEDFQEAVEWMIEAENLMPQIFLEMVGKSDNQTLNELYHFVRGLWENPLTKNQPVRKGLIVNMLRSKVPTYQIDSVIDVAVQAELIVKVPIKYEVEPGKALTEIRYKPAPKPGLYKFSKGA